MSLTRDEWVKLWVSAKTIESMLNQQYEVGRPLSFERLYRINREVFEIKKLVQQVIGQME